MIANRFRIILAFCAVGVVGSGGPARGQGFVVDRRPHVPIARSFEVREVRIESRVRDQVAEVQVAQTFHNPGSFQIEAEYLFPLPEEGAIQNFVLMVDGRELPGKLMSKEEARRTFEEIVRRKKDPALLEYMGRGLIRTSVFPIPPGGNREVTLRFTKLLERDREVITFAFPLATQKFTAKPIDKLTIKARLESQEPIKAIYSPSHDVEIDRDGDHRATIEYVAHDTTPSADFRLVYTLAEGALGASVLSTRPSMGEDGYFLLLASPDVEKPDEKPEPKCVIFVLDRSGSMSGKKIEQAREALKFVLDNLRKGDTFNIIAYDDRVETFQPELQRYDEHSRKEALRFVENLFPGGSTNINDAVEAALEMIHDDSRPNYVLFLTDGLPTAGQTREAAIAANAKEANDADARIFSFGVGFDVNARLLDRLSGGNGGTTVYVKPVEDIEAHVARFYARLTSPVLTDIRVEFDGTDVNRLSPRDIPDLFEGSQLVITGRYRDSGPVKIRLSGKVGHDRQTFRFEADLASPHSGQRAPYVETLWAIRRVGFLIDQIDLHGKSDELTEELVKLSQKYGILTPYTSFLADENVPLHAQAQNLRRADSELAQLREVQGQSGVAQRAYKADLQNAQSAAAPEAAPQVVERGNLGAAAGARAAAKSQGLIFRSVKPPGAQGPGMGGGFGGMAGMKARPPAANAAPIVARDALGRARVVENVRHVGNKTFFRKGDRWVDATVTPELEANAITIEQFSDAYFDLARKQGAEQNQYLTFEEPVTVNLDGQVYKIDRPRRD